MYTNRQKIIFGIFSALGIVLVIGSIVLRDPQRPILSGGATLVGLLLFGFFGEKVVAVKCQGCDEKIANPFLSECPFCTRPIDRRKK